MDEKRLAQYREKLREKERSTLDLLQRTESLGRESDGEVLDIADQALMSYTREFNFSKSSNDRRLLALVRDALHRVDHDSYGECLHCGEEIETRRLEAVPWAMYCLACQTLNEKGRLET